MWIINLHTKQSAPWCLKRFTTHNADPKKLKTSRSKVSIDFDTAACTNGMSRHVHAGTQMSFKAVLGCILRRSDCFLMSALCGSSRRKFLDWYGLTDEADWLDLHMQ